MAENIVTAENEGSTGSPFDRIRRFDESGRECWYGRELMILLGYLQWRRFDDAVGRAKTSCENSGIDADAHFDHLPGSANGQGRGKIGDNYKLSRHACHLIAMNGDPRKAEIAAAQKYFSKKVREAETIIPAQNDRIRELELEVRLAECKERMAVRHDAMISLHGPATVLALEGKSDQIVEVEKPTIEVIDDRHNVKFEGQTLKQVAEYIETAHGIRYKSGADLKRALVALGGEGLIAQTPRTITAEYIPKEFLKETYDILIRGDRQKLIGE